MTFGLRLLVVVWVVRIKSGGRIDFCGATVLVASSGDPVSFNTTVGGGEMSKRARVRS